MNGELLCQSYKHLACLTAVLQQLCVPCSCLASSKKRTEIPRKMNMPNSVFDVAAAVRIHFFVGQPCGVVNTMRLSCETHKLVIADRCTAVVKLM